MKNPRALLTLIVLMLASALLTACLPSAKTVVTVIAGTPAVTIQVVTATAIADLPARSRADPMGSLVERS